MGRRVPACRDGTGTGEVIGPQRELRSPGADARRHSVGAEVTRSLRWIEYTWVRTVFRER